MKKQREIISAILKNIKYLIILKHYNSYIEKIDKYKKRLEFKFL